MFLFFPTTYIKSPIYRKKIIHIKEKCGGSASPRFSPTPANSLVFRFVTNVRRGTGHLQHKMLVGGGLFLHILKGIAFSSRTVNTQVVLATVIALGYSRAFRIDMTKLVTSSAWCGFIWARDSGVIELPGLSSLPSSICPLFHVWSEPFR